MITFKKYKKIFSMAVRYTLGAVIIVWLINSDLISATVVNLISAEVAVTASLLVIIQMVLASLRVKLLLGKNQIKVPIWRCVQFNSIGVFYSLFLPGGMSGDLTRAYYFHRAYPNQSKASLFGALIIDRLLGTAAMITIGLVTGTYLMSSLGLREFIIASWVIFCVILIGYLIISRLHRIGDKSKISYLGKFSRFVERIDIREYGFSVVILSLILSFLGHFCAVLIIYLCSTLLRSGLDFLQVIAVAPIGLLANALPLTPGGIGIGEKGFDIMYRLAGGNEGGNSFLLSRIFLFQPAILGGILVGYLFIKSHKTIFEEKNLK
jgi:uncharacterized protein (TIRG00374 family)